MSDKTEQQFLYGFPEDEELHFDIADVYEFWAEAEQLDPEDRPESLTICQWSVCPIDNVIPRAESILETIVEDYADDAGFQGASEAMAAAALDPDVVAAFDAARTLLLSKFTWREADRKVGEHVITWDEHGEPQVDGQPMYRPRCRGFHWMGQSFYHCDVCGNDIVEHEGLAWSKPGAKLFERETELIPFDEARRRIPLFAHYVTPIGHPEGPYRYEKGWDDLPKIPVSSDESLEGARQ